MQQPRSPRLLATPPRITFDQLKCATLHMHAACQLCSHAITLCVVGCEFTGCLRADQGCAAARRTDTLLPGCPTCRGMNASVLHTSPRRCTENSTPARASHLPLPARVSSGTLSSGLLHGLLMMRSESCVGVSPQQCCPPLSAGTRANIVTLYPQSHGATRARRLHTHSPSNRWHARRDPSDFEAGNESAMQPRALQLLHKRLQLANTAAVYCLIFESANRVVCDEHGRPPHGPPAAGRQTAAWGSID